MKSIYLNIEAAAKEYDKPGNLVVGANIAGFEKVAQSMTMHGVV